MGRKALHTQEQVFQAADALAAAGKEVSATALRDALGGGSLTTIYKHFAGWEAARKTAPAPVVIEMPDSVKAAFAAVWQTLSTEAGREIAAIREKADAEIKAVTRRLEESVDAIAQLEAEQETDASRIETLETALATAATEAHRAETEAAAREAALSATAEQLRQQIGEQQQELARVHAELEAGTERHAAELARVTGDFSRQLAEQSEAAKGARDEAERLRAALDENRAAKLAAEQRAAVAEARADDAGRRVEVLQADLAEVSKRERVQIEAAATASAEAARLAEQLKDQKGSSAEVITKLEESKQRMEAELTAGRREVRDVSGQLAQASGELEALRAQVASQQAVITNLTIGKAGAGGQS